MSLEALSPEEEEEEEEKPAEEEEEELEPLTEQNMRSRVKGVLREDPDLLFNILEEMAEQAGLNFLNVLERAVVRWARGQ